jgi:hypothetical protein
MTVLIFTPRQPPPSEPGNGALEIVRDYFENVHPARGHGATDCGAMLDGTAHLPAGDHFLMWLAIEGFKVVPL